MLPETLPGSDFKKEYKFLWYISSEGFNRYALDKDDATLQLFEKTVANPVFSAYVSQLAEQVEIPDDEFETETLNRGPVIYKYPKRVTMNDITVTYLEDSYETVYNFHKAWFQAIRCGNTTGIKAPTKLSATARYVPFENTMTAAEYLIFRNNALERTIGENTTGRPVTGKQNKFLDNLMATARQSQSLLEAYNKPMGGTMYPKVYPYKIKRSAANKGGSDLAKVTVTYCRLPYYKVNHSALQIYKGNNWEDVESRESMSYPMPDFPVKLF